MKKDPNEEDLWWAELDLPTGHYEYQYVLPGGVVIADPLSRRISNDRTRIEIGPGGVTTADNNIWESNEYIRPLMDTLVIYELHIDDFSAMGNCQGRFEDIIEKLDHLKSIGINAIELLPIYEFPGNHSWGYDPILISSLESNYGTPFEFKKLVDEATTLRTKLTGSILPQLFNVHSGAFLKRYENIYVYTFYMNRKQSKPTS